MNHLSDESMKRLQAHLSATDDTGAKYHLIRQLGAGGMGEVYLAEDSELQRIVALKAISVDDSHGQMVERMRREARTLAKLEHPAIVPVHDVGSLPDGRVFYTMKYVEGKTLTDFRKTETDIRKLLRLFQRVCEAIAFAHSRGVIHRDIKPDNIMIGSFGEALVMDWGVARALDDTSVSNLSQSDTHSTSSRLTQSGAIVGTPAFMSPEQLTGDHSRIDNRSDIYSLGATLYFVLTGKEPPRDRVGPLSPARINPAVTRPINSICQRATAYDPEKRYSTAREMAEDIAALLDGEKVQAHSENVFELIWRFVVKHKLIFAIILAYTLVRFVLYFVSH